MTLVFLITAVLLSACRGGSVTSGSGSYQDGIREGATMASTDYKVGLSNQVHYDCNPNDPLDGRSIPSADDLTRWENGCVVGYNTKFQSLSPNG